MNQLNGVKEAAVKSLETTVLNNITRILLKEQNNIHKGIVLDENLLQGLDNEQVNALIREIEDEFYESLFNRLNVPRTYKDDVRNAVKVDIEKGEF